MSNWNRNGQTDFEEQLFLEAVGRDEDCLDDVPDGVLADIRCPKCGGQNFLTQQHFPDWEHAGQVDIKNREVSEGDSIVERYYKLRLICVQCEAVFVDEPETLSLQTIRTRTRRKK